MHSEWTAQEKKWLETKSRFLFEKPVTGEMVPLAAFLEPDLLDSFLEKTASRIDPVNQSAVASIFIKRYAFLVVGTLASWSFFRKPFMISIKNSCLVHSGQTEAWLPAFFIEPDFHNKGSGSLQHVLLHVGQVIESVKKASGVSSLILWENVAVYVFWLYETLAKEKEFSDVYKRALEDFHWLLAPEQTSLFGNYRLNPLARYYNEKTALTEQGKMVRIRRTCCLNDQLAAGGKNCSSCPKTNQFCSGKPAVNELEVRAPMFAEYKNPRFYF